MNTTIKDLKEMIENPYWPKNDPREDEEIKQYEAEQERNIDHANDNK